MFGNKFEYLFGNSDVEYPSVSFSVPTALFISYFLPEKVSVIQVPFNKLEKLWKVKIDPLPIRTVGMAVNNKMYMQRMFYVPSTHTIFCERIHEVDSTVCL